MTDDSWPRLAYLVLLCLAVVVAYAAVYRSGLRRTLGHAAVWAVLFALVAAGAGVWQEIRAQAPVRQAIFADAGRIETDRARDGHFYLTLQVNGTPVRFVVDTGATDIVLSRADAARLGLHPEDLAFTGLASTANGQVRTAPVRLAEVRAGDIVDTRVRALVNEGEMDISLLGMTYLERFERIEMTRDRLVLQR